MAAPGHFRPIRGARRNMRNTPPGLNQSDFSVFSQGSYMDDKTSKAATAERGKALAAALSQIEKQFGKGSVMRYGDNQVEHDIQVVSTVSLGLDIALGVGGLPRGRVIGSEERRDGKEGVRTGKSRG